MKIRTLSFHEMKRVRPQLIRFIRRHGDGRITHRAIRWFQQLIQESWNEGMIVAATLDKNIITGLIVLGNYGLDESFIAVHPSYRKQKIGETLLQHALHRLGKIYTRVACDNTPSLKLCFACGLTAFQLTYGPTKKPTLWLGGGAWSRRDLEEKLLRQ
ncbi:GNAT family N-acetyltransferase [Hazenella coriacea]|uniref:Acetyltransferase (GNAT) family protein n=1 Tax=Hazenella coriacea TaxID=1179467 RepID=A0A4R3LAK5_9BACL|nr:GNAT family N-acetyltransferase [Hazenella coriacea]TCS96779.1 acetyltransferase (GNAT) family protein [Hazenella coriacea]